MIARCAGLIAVSAAMSIVVSASAATPDQNDVAIRLSWVRDDGAADCPDARVIEQRVRVWVGRDPFSATAQTAAEVTVLRRADAFVARIRVRASNGAVVGERVITSERWALGAASSGRPCSVSGSRTHTSRTCSRRSSSLSTAVVCPHVPAPTRSPMPMQDSGQRALSPESQPNAVPTASSKVHPFPRPTYAAAASTTA